MNVKQLKEYLSDLPDDMEVTVGDGYGWLYEIGSVHPTLTKEKGKEKSVLVIQPTIKLEEVEEW